MTIFSVSLRIQSETLSAEEMVTALGLEPDVVMRKGEPVSPSSSTIRKWAEVRFLSSLSGGRREPEERVGEYLLELVTPLERLAVSGLGDDASASVSIGMHSRGMGNIVSFDPPFLAVLANANAWLSVDAYPPLEQDA